MHLRADPLTWVVAALLCGSAFGFHARAEKQDRAALATALNKVPATLEQGLRAGEAVGKPISAKFEIEDGKLQLSMYTSTANGYTEVIIAPDKGKFHSTEKITEADDLKDATAQSAAMQGATVPLTTATEQGVKALAGSRTVSIFPELKGGHPLAAVTLLRGGEFTSVSEKLD